MYDDIKKIITKKLKEVFLPLHNIPQLKTRERGERESKREREKWRTQQ